MLPERVPSSSSALMRLATPPSVTSTMWPPNGPEEIVRTSSFRLVPKSWLEATPRVRLAVSPASFATAESARPSEVTAHTSAAVVVSMLATTRSCRLGVARFPPSTGSRPSWPEDDNVTRHSSSRTSVEAAGARSAGEKVCTSLSAMISERRSRPWSSTNSRSSAKTNVRCRVSLASNFS